MSLPNKLFCKYCLLSQPPFYRKKGPHFGAYCSKCARWIRWIPKRLFSEKNIPENKRFSLFLP